MPAVGRMELWTYLSFHLFPEGVEYPEVDIPPPMPFLLCWRDICNCSFVNISHSILIPKCLLQPGVIKPGVIVLGVLFDLLFVPDSLEPRFFKKMLFFLKAPFLLNLLPL